MTGDNLAPEPIVSPEAFAGALLVVSSVIALVQDALMAGGYIETAFTDVFTLIVVAVAGVGFAVLAVVGELRRGGE